MPGLIRTIDRYEHYGVGLRESDEYYTDFPEYMYEPPKPKRLLPERMTNEEIKRELSKKNVLEEIHDKEFEVLLGINRIKRETQKSKHSYHYVPSDLEDARRLSSCITKGKVIYDIGCGLGKVIFYNALWFKNNQFIGLDYEQKYIDRCQEVKERFNIDNANFICADAMEHDFSKGNIFFMYTPFVGYNLQRVLNKLKQIAKWKDIIIFFHGPASEVLDEQTWLRQGHSQYIYKPHPYFKIAHKQLRMLAEK